MPRPTRHHRLPRLLARAALAALLLAPALPAVAPPVGAQDPAPSVPGLGPLPEGVTLNYAVSGPIGDVSGPGTLVLERIDLDEGEAIPGSDAAQILVAESGSLTLIDDLGLEATLAEGQAYFADAGSAAALRTNTSTRLVRAIVWPQSTATVDLSPSGCSNNVVIAPGGTFTVHNISGQTVSLAIDDLAIFKGLLPGREFLVTVPEIEGTWVMECGFSQTATVTSTGAVGDAGRVPASNALVSTNLDIPADNLSLALLALTMEPGAALGPVTMAGLVGIYSADSDLTVTRPGRLDSTLPAGKGVVLPQDTTATLENRTDRPTEVLVVAVVPEAVFGAAEAGVVTTIDLGACPSELIVVAGSDVALVNTTTSPLTFAIPSLDLSVRVAPAQTRTFAVPTRTGRWLAECGSTRSTATILPTAP